MEKKRTEVILLVFTPSPLATFTLSITVYPPLEILTGNGWKGGRWGEYAGSMQKPTKAKQPSCLLKSPHLPTFSLVRPLL